MMKASGRCSDGHGVPYSRTRPGFGPAWGASAVLVLGLERSIMGNATWRRVWIEAVPYAWHPCGGETRPFACQACRKAVAYRVPVRLPDDVSACSGLPGRCVGWYHRLGDAG